MRRYIRLLSVVALLVALVSMQILSSAAQDGSSITMAFLENEPAKLDPQAADSLDDYQVLWNVYEGLVGYDPKTLAPDNSGLAESWDISDDGLVYTFHLRQGVKFHNGREMTADDVKYSFNRLANPDTGTSYTTLLLNNVVGFSDMRVEDATKRATDLTGVQVIDPSTIQITLTSPVSSFLNQMTLPGGFIVPKEAAEAEGFNENPVGTGPYKFVEWVHGDHVTLAANPDYWGGKPSIDTVTIRVIREASQQVIEFEAGNLDLATVSEADIPRLQADETLSKELLVAPVLNAFHLRINLNDPALKDVRVRKAIALGINRQVIVDTILGGQGTAGHGLIPPGLSAYDADANPFPYDPEQAKQLLADAGYGSGLELELTTGTVETELRALAAIQQNLADIGITLHINSVERALFSETMNACKTQLGTIMWSQDYPDPENFDGLLYTPATSGSRSACGYGAYEGFEKVKDMLAQASAMSLGADRDALYRDIENLGIGEDVLVIPLYHTVRTMLVNPRLQGTILDSNALARFRYITVVS